MSRRSRPILASVLICALIVAAFVYVSYSAVVTKSATLDEPLHVASAYAASWLHDYRLDPENPPLWKYWAMLFARRDALIIDVSDPQWQAQTTPDAGQIYTTRLLYQSPPNDGPALIDAARRAMILLSAIVLIVAAAWAWRLAGPAAAIATLLLLALDPTFLAHAPIVKNDIAMTLLMLILAIALWSMTNRLTVTNTVAVALACGAAMGVKFSGLLWPGIAVVTLLARAFWPRPWVCWGREIVSRIGRVMVVLLVGLIIAASSFATIWATYGFRYSVAADPNIHLQTAEIVKTIAESHLTARLGRAPTTMEVSAEAAEWSPPISVRTVLFLDRHRLLPEAWSAGFLGVYREMLRHRNYLLGQIREGGGWWYYFPLAFVFKTPLIALAVLATVVIVLAIPRSRRAINLGDDFQRAIICVAIACAIYLVSAMMQSINHGVRHLLPISALLFIIAGVVFAKLLAVWRKPTLTVGAALSLLLAVETLSVHPNYVAFFNIASGGARGGLSLLGDSNLDWGQDLPLLAEWQRRNPDERLYYCVYGYADPAAEGIVYTNLPGGFLLGPPAEPFSSPGVIAISATRLQGLFLSPELQVAYARLRNQKPREVLGGTIYLFDFIPPARASTSKAAVLNR